MSSHYASFRHNITQTHKHTFSLPPSLSLCQVVVLPYTVDEFTVAVQDNFKKGVASSVGVEASAVTINSFTAATSRRLIAHRKLLSDPGIDVDFSVDVAEDQKAQDMMTMLTIENINTNLEAQGVKRVSAVKSAPSVSAVSADADATEEASNQGQNSTMVIIVAVCVGVAAVFAGVLAFCYCKKSQSNKVERTSVGSLTTVGSLGFRVAHAGEMRACA